jgi:diamine N-acetyltransferase
MSANPSFENDAEPGPIVNIRGERVALGLLHRGLLPLIERWENDFRSMDRGGDNPRPLSAETFARGWERNLRGERDDWLGFAIYALPDLRPIGHMNLRDFTNPHGKAEFGIKICEANARGLGYGTEARGSWLASAETSC